MAGILSQMFFKFATKQGLLPINLRPTETPSKIETTARDTHNPHITKQNCKKYLVHKHFLQLHRYIISIFIVI